MWISRRSYNEKLELLVATQKLLLKERAQAQAHLVEWNLLVRRVNKKGGAAFLEQGVMPGKTQLVSEQFTQDEIRDLIRLCHPDKHGNSEIATRVTQKLLEMRKE